MRPVLSVTSECAPLVKTGGLADVAGALPAAVSLAGWEMRTLLPGYPQVMDRVKLKQPLLSETDLFGGTGVIRPGTGGGLDVLVLDAPHLFDRSGAPYLDAEGEDWPDNPERFAALSWMAARIAAEGAGSWRPETLHCHDWQAGFAPVYLQALGASAGSVFTIHNMAFHGLAPATRRAALRLPAEGFTQDGFEFWNQVSSLKAGITWSNKVTTVSPTYARELMRTEFGMGLDGVLRNRSDDFVGILNGIDTVAWDPSTDPHIQTYKSPKGKARMKKELRKEFGLGDSAGPLCIVVSRLSDQKGLDLLVDALPVLVDRGGQLALLGTGDRRIEARLRAVAAAHPSVSVHIEYDEAKSHRMMAGADAILIPSRFEPCGLTQLYALRYGTVPVVAYTGGLVDTVINASPAAIRSGVATGIQFHPVTVDGLARGLFQLLELYSDKKVWSRMQTNAMRSEVGWSASAVQYAELYDQVAPGS
ncbi:MAG: glycogen synthase GlgA [Pseudomonadota bacterium]